MSTTIKLKGRVDEKRLIGKINLVPSASSGGPLQAKTVYPSHSEQAVAPDEDYYGLAVVTVKPVPRVPVAEVGIMEGMLTWGEFVENVVNISTETEVSVEDVPISAIQSNGSQYIDSGVVAQSGLKVEIQAKLATSDNYQAFFGSQEPNAKNRMTWFYYMNTEMYYYYGSLKYPFVKRSDFTAKHTYVFDNNKAYIDGTEVSFSTSIPAETFIGTQTMYLFAQNKEGAVSDMADMILYYCKIWQNGVLVRDFVPHEEGDGTIGMMDLVENKFYASKGSGQFTGVYEFLG